MADTIGMQTEELNETETQHYMAANSRGNAKLAAPLPVQKPVKKNNQNQFQQPNGANNQMPSDGMVNFGDQVKLRQ